MAKPKKEVNVERAAIRWLAEKLKKAEFFSPNETAGNLWLFIGHTKESGVVSAEAKDADEAFLKAFEKANPQAELPGV